MTNDKNRPCYQCTKRHHLCHSSCADYEEYKRLSAERAEIIRKKREEDYLLSDARMRIIKRKTKKD